MSRNVSLSKVNFKLNLGGVKENRKRKSKENRGEREEVSIHFSHSNFKEALKRPFISPSGVRG